MKFSIIIPSWNNLNYLKICLDSIKKNSKYEHDVNIHLNEGIDGSVEYLSKNRIKFSRSQQNIGLCSGSNRAASLAESDYIIYTNDDMYFLPNWDFFLVEELKKIKNNLYFLTGTTIGPIGCALTGGVEIEKLSVDELKNFDFNCGKTAEEFDEIKLLSNYENVKYFDHQGSYWSPCLMHKSIWKRIGGFSEEFDPGFASDTDLSMKLWKIGVRIFKGINNFRVYHFGSITTRKKKGLKRNKGNRTFLLKWGISSDLFIKHYLHTNTPYDGPLKDRPRVNFKYLIELIRCKIKLVLLKIYYFSSQ